MNMQTQIEQKIQQAMQPDFLEVVNESHMHNVPPGSESHFKVTIVSEQFNGKMLIARHRQINGILAEELSNRIHALALHTLTPEEYFQKAGKVADSPLCMGGGKG
ncbi:BolA/IbaG family iron-sulfur metabolism protein [Candidatus Thiothrix sp. Deng01]|uniref:DNA-binding transcriptional regulator BolA n=2 Tax=Thiothrix TaxID=1030 RepID=A0A7L6APN0_9GAMM|nr:BolA/IbaG family iron-sulfur metabolism protein [Candidatus Thiothrix sp. Deng01]MEB4592885.1 BolA/IbaG family iron-sulfur metabolism protein [Candidatus Thiothrix sp. Deng01]QLQ31056.1 MAG: BolA/IbaG family iron-sulfur metabolism protein [Candidatus Thiothrix singaporensis]